MAALDMIDDDQMWMTMAYKRWPELFEIHISGWFLPIKEYGGEHLSIQLNKSRKSLKTALREKGITGTIKYLYVKAFHRMNVERYDYWRRLKRLLRNYN